MLSACKPQSPFLLQLSKLIILNSGMICNSNFYDRAEVIQTANRLTRHGDVLCSLCGGSLIVHGSYVRHTRDERGERHDGWIAQGHCFACNIYPSLIPNFLMSYKHYKTEVIESAVLEAEEQVSLKSCPADNSTIRRWVKQFRRRGGQAVGWLLSILCLVYERHISTIELQNKGLMKQLERLARELPIPRIATVIGTVNVILTRHNFGYL